MRKQTHSYILPPRAQLLLLERNIKLLRERGCERKAQQGEQELRRLRERIEK